MRELVRAGADINTRDAAGNSAVKLAALTGRVDVTEALMSESDGEKSPSPAKLINSTESSIPVRSSPTSQPLAASSIDPDSRRPSKSASYAGNTIIHTAAARGTMSIIRRLVEQGDTINSANSENCTPLHLSLAAGKFEVAALLILAPFSVSRSDVSVPQCSGRSKMRFTFRRIGMCCRTGSSSCIALWPGGLAEGWGSWVRTPVGRARHRSKEPGGHQNEGLWDL